MEKRWDTKCQEHTNSPWVGPRVAVIFTQGLEVFFFHMIVREYLEDLSKKCEHYTKANWSYCVDMFHCLGTVLTC